MARTVRATDMVVSAEARGGFYPTPPAMADILLSGIDWNYVSEVLEPSAGSGNIVKRISEKYYIRGGYGDRKCNVDCIEIDEYLRAILRYEFCGQRMQELWDKMRDIENRSGRTEAYKELRQEIYNLESVNCHIIFDDFLKFDSRKAYDLIVMNPPFADGDAHLLKAIQIQSKHGGAIRCILNAETIRNPYTNRRMLLKRKLEGLNAEVSFHKGMFSDGERPTEVEVAVVKIIIPEKKRDSEFYSRLRTAAKVEETVSDVKDMTVTDFLSQIVTRFNVECDAGISLINEFKAMRPYILDSFDADCKYSYPNLTLCVGDPSRLSRSGIPPVNDYLKLVRKKYWSALFSNKEFVGKLTSNLRDKYREMVDKLADYDFTLFNIQQISVEMNAEMGKGIEETIVSLFSKLTEQHSWYPEMEKNIHYYNGWQTNKVHKINSKVIIPVYGMFSSYSWDKEAFSLHEAEKTISDIEKVFEYLDGNMTAAVDLHGVLQAAHDAGQTKNIQCKFFSVTLYKKGTMHIKFHNQNIVDKFNIYCCKKKNWLPPNYGRVKYSETTDKEKAVVDGFNGDGTVGAGKDSYDSIVAKASYYLAEPEQKMPALMAPAT